MSLANTDVAARGVPVNQSSDKDTGSSVGPSLRGAVITVRADGPMVGDVLGDYIIEQTAGVGGHANVFRARAQRSGEMVALKLIRREVCGSGQLVHRLRREAEALARLEHPAIVKIIEIGEHTSGWPYLVMEWIHGQTLNHELRKRGTFSLDELLGVLSTLCEALAAAHDAGIVHRDLKPSNLMTIPEGDWFRLKLVDFGLAKLLEPDTEADRLGLTTTGMRLGTPQYMAPEQFSGGEIDARTDIYALGVISYLLLTGQLPFQGETPAELAEMHLFAPPPRVDRVVAVPPGVDEAIDRCLAKHPADRHATVRDYLDALQRSARLAARSFAGRPAAPSGRPADRCIGIHLAAVFDGPDEAIGDDVLLAIDEGLWLAEEALTAAGMSVTPMIGDAILAESPLAGDARAGEALEIALHRALDLHDRLVATQRSWGARPGLSFSVTVHLAEERAALDDPRWTARSPRTGVTVTRDFRAALGGRCTLQPIPGLADRYRIERALDAQTLRLSARRRAASRGFGQMPAELLIDTP
jgi:eukaryotic-like serine/threonine-protein kinase